MDPTGSFLVLISIFFRIGACVFCIKRARDLHRDKLTWGVFAFFAPVIAIIWILFLKPRGGAVSASRLADTLDNPENFKS